MRLPETEQRPRRLTEGAAESFDGDTQSLSQAADAGPLTRRNEVEQARALLLAALELLTPRVRCRRCGHELHAERSQRLGIGPECRRREAAVLRVIA